MFIDFLPIVIIIIIYAQKIIMQIKILCLYMC